MTDTDLELTLLARGQRLRAAQAAQRDALQTHQRAGQMTVGPWVPALVAQKPRAKRKPRVVAFARVKSA